MPCPVYLDRTKGLPYSNLSPFDDQFYTLSKLFILHNMAPHIMISYDIARHIHFCCVIIGVNIGVTMCVNIGANMDVYMDVNIGVEIGANIALIVVFNIKPSSTQI